MSWKQRILALAIFCAVFFGFVQYRYGKESFLAIHSWTGELQAEAQSSRTALNGGGEAVAAGTTTVPSLQLNNVLMDTPNDVVPLSGQSVPGAAAGVGEAAATPSNGTAKEESDLIRIQNDLPLTNQEYSGSPSTPFSDRCEVEVPRFLDRYSQALSEHLKRSPSEPDRWVGKNPLCGIHGLYNLTGLILLPRGPGLRTAVVGEMTQFSIGICGSPFKDKSRYVPSRSLAGKQGEGCHDVYLVARLHGPSIIAANVSQNAADCSFHVWYTLFDPGEYKLEVRVVWLDGLGPEKQKGRLPITLRKSHSKWGKKPNQHYAYNAACEDQTHLMGSPFTVSATGAISNRYINAPKSAITQDQRHLAPTGQLSVVPREHPPLCNKNNFRGSARWVTNRNDRNCSSAPASERICSGDPHLLNDIKPFNWDYLWAPLHCRYHFWKFGTGPESNCTNKKGMLLLMGDSTTREYAQNFRFFDLRKSGLSVNYANWKLEHQWFTRKMAYDSLRQLGKELKQMKPVVVAANLGPLHLIAGLSTEDWKYYVDQWAALFSNRKEDFPFLERLIFLGPSAIHYATNAMSAQRMMLWIEYAQATLVPLGFEFIDAWQVTGARPESSWDGVHYAAERGKAQMKHVQKAKFSRLFKWNGGVSVMLTTILLNVLCNPS